MVEAVVDLSGRGPPCPTFAHVNFHEIGGAFLDRMMKEAANTGLMQLTGGHVPTVHPRWETTRPTQLGRRPDAPIATSDELSPIEDEEVEAEEDDHGDQQTKTEEDCRDRFRCPSFAVSEAVFRSERVVANAAGFVYFVNARTWTRDLFVQRMKYLRKICIRDARWGGQKLRKTIDVYISHCDDEWACRARGGSCQGGEEDGGWGHPVSGGDVFDGKPYQNPPTFTAAYYGFVPQILGSTGGTSFFSAPVPPITPEWREGWEQQQKEGGERWPSSCSHVWSEDVANRSWAGVGGEGGGELEEAPGVSGVQIGGGQSLELRDFLSETADATFAQKFKDWDREKQHLCELFGSHTFRAIKQEIQNVFAEELLVDARVGA